jgi:hypothetical protein
MAHGGLVDAALAQPAATAFAAVEDLEQQPAVDARLPRSPISVSSSAADGFADAQHARTRSGARSLAAHVARRRAGAHQHAPGDRVGLAEDGQQDVAESTRSCRPHRLADRLSSASWAPA